MSNYQCSSCGTFNMEFTLNCPGCAILKEHKKNRDQAAMFERSRREREDEERDRQIQFNRSKLNNTQNQSHVASDSQSNNILDRVDIIRDELRNMGCTDQVINAVVLDIVLPQLRQGLSGDLIVKNIAEYIDLHFPNNKKRAVAEKGSANLLVLFLKFVRLFIFICSSFPHAFFSIFVFDTFFSIKEPGATEFFLVIFIVSVLSYSTNKIDNKDGFVQAMKIQLFLFVAFIVCGGILLGSTGKLN
jgi:hypothetical protein